MKSIRPVGSKLLRTVNRYAFYPGIVFGSMAAFGLFVGQVPVVALAGASAAISITAIVIMCLFERLFPYRLSWNRPKGDSGVVNFFTTNVMLPAVLKIAEFSLALVFILCGQALGLSAMHSLWPHELSLWLQIGLALVACEFFYYWFHRLGHQVQFFWRFHSIHHVVKRVYWDNAGYFHPVDLFFGFFLYLIPVFLLGVPAEVLAGLILINAVTGLLEHANVDYSIGPFNRFFNTAQLHRWHHSVVPEISAKNFGKVLSIWDVVFGSYYRPKGEAVGAVGIVGEEIPDSFRGHLVHPFRALKTRIPIRHAIYVLVIMLAFAASASAAIPGATRGADGFLSCVPLEGKSSLMIATSGLDIYGRQPLYSIQRGRNCAQVRALKHPIGPWTTFDRISISLPHEIAPEIAAENLQLVNGASKPWPHRDLSTSIAAYSDISFTTELNRTLTEAYGVRFAAKVFERSVLQNARNSAAADEVEFLAKQRLSMRRPNKLGATFDSALGEVTVFVNMGLGWDEKMGPNTAPYVHAFIRDIRGTGARVVFAQRDPYGSIATNAQLIAAQLARESMNGRDIVILGLCKGAPEIVRAASLAWSTDGRVDSRLSGGGRLRSVIFLSGMLTGTFFSDKFGKSDILRSVGGVAAMVPAISWAENGKTIAALGTMRTTKIAAAIEGVRFNDDVLVLSVTGAPLTQSSIPKESPLAGFAELNRSMKILPEANDGFLPLEGSLPPASMTRNSVSLVFDASHLLADGHFRAFDLRRASERVAVYGAILDYALAQN